MTAALVHPLRPDWPERAILDAIERDRVLLEGRRLLAKLVDAAGDPDQLWPTAWPTPKSSSRNDF
jgi:hypothetical protein